MQTVSLLLAAMLAPVLVSAQQTTTDTPTDKSSPDKQAKPAKPADKPADKSTADRETPDGRKLEKLEDSEPPAVKIGKPPGEHKVTETRDDSGIKEVKVETGVSTYYVKPNQQVGNAMPGDAQSSFNRGAEWKVLEFNLGEKKKKTEEEPQPDDSVKK